MSEWNKDREVMGAATEGPWYEDPDYPTEVISERVRIAETVSLNYINCACDAKFIARARTRWPAALDEIERLLEENERLGVLVIDHHRCFVEKSDKCDELQEEVAQVIKERDQLRAEVEELRDHVRCVDAGQKYNFDVRMAHREIEKVLRTEVEKWKIKAKERARFSLVQAHWRKAERRLTRAWKSAAEAAESTLAEWQEASPKLITASDSEVAELLAAARALEEK